MSAAVTATELQNVLSDYKIHLTGYNATAETQESAPAQVETPPNWPTNYHHVPDYRPINRHLDREQRPKGSNAFEYSFLSIMFTGVFLNATMARVWGATLGPYFPGLFRYAIGGEW